jgi:hypothetical protein
MPTVAALTEQQLLMLIRRAGIRCWLVVEMPAFPALLSAQSPRPFGARRAHCRQGRPARDHHLLPLAPRCANAAQLHRADARTMLDRDRLDDITRQRLRHPLGT